MRFYGFLLLVALVPLLPALGLLLRRRHRDIRVSVFRERFAKHSLVRGARRKVLIISTTLVRDNGALLKQRRLWLPALNVALLAALTPPEWDVEILYETIEEIPFDTDADLIALSCMGIGLWRGLQIAKEFRKRGKTVIVGGPMASIAPELVMEHCDAVCVGDAEELWGEILGDFERGALKHLYSDRGRLNRLESGHSCIHPLAGVPTPRYDLIVQKRIGMWLPVLVGRGCPNHCEFCSIFAWYGSRYLRRPVADVIRDVDAVKSLGCSHILLIDDNIGSDPEYALQLFRALESQKVTWMGQCDLMVAQRPELLRAMVRSGCRTLSVGLESVNQRSLDIAGKQFVQAGQYEGMLATFTAHGIDVSSEMILGMDGDGPGVFDRTAEFILKSGIRAPRFYILTPIPGTPLHRRLSDEGRILDSDHGHYTAARAVFEPVEMSPEQLESGYWRLYEEVYSWRGIYRRFRVGGTGRSLAHTLFLLGVNLQYRKQVRERLCPGVL